MAKSALMCSNVCKQCNLHVNNNNALPSILNNVLGMDLNLHTRLGFDGLSCTQVLKYVIQLNLNYPGSMGPTGARMCVNAHNSEYLYS